MLYGDAAIESYLEHGFPGFRFDGFDLAGIVESHFMHEGRVSFLRMLSPLLSIKNLHVAVDGKDIVKGISLAIHPGEIHAIMGPNGSGKSSFVNAIMGHPKFKVTSGSAFFLNDDLLALSASDRAARGLFLAFQYPKEISGVTLRSFLFAAYKAQSSVRRELPRIVSPIKFKKTLEHKMQALHMGAKFSDRFLNKGFSGGEKKKAEILQMSVLQPRLALLDETDSGLDIDALRTVASGINAMRSRDFSALIVTHYARLLDYVKPDLVHVMVRGQIMESGRKDIAQRLEKEGYAKYGTER